MARGRSLLGTFLILITPIAIIGMVALRILLGSMGMDIHWESKSALYEAVFLFLLGLAGCLFIGMKLRKAAKRRVQ